MTLTRDTLESWLWESASILHGSIDSSDFKNYIFGLLFLKRFNDVFEERVAKCREDEGLSQAHAEAEVQDKWDLYKAGMLGDRPNALLYGQEENLGTWPWPNSASTCTTCRPATSSVARCW